jgi:hypothetical protein
MCQVRGCDGGIEQLRHGGDMAIRGHREKQVIGPAPCLPKTQAPALLNDHGTSNQ